MKKSLGSCLVLANSLLIGLNFVIVALNFIRPLIRSILNYLKKRKMTLRGISGVRNQQVIKVDLKKLHSM